MSDRTVHGWSADGGEIVRYDRAGKWFLEYKNNEPPRKRLNVLAAARFAGQGRAFLGRPGGGRFDRAVADLSQTSAPDTLGREDTA